MSLPQCIEEFVSENDPVRAYDAFVDALDFNQLGIVINSYKVGNSEYHPKSMLKLLVYGPSYGTRSSRKLERETYHNMSFIWLMGGLKPDHKTISRFRQKNKKALKKVLKLSARMCIKLDLIAGNVLFVDGTKIRANASASKTHGKQWYEEKLQKIDQNISQLLAECETEDQQEAHMESFVKMDKELAKSEKLKSRILDVLAEFDKTDKKKINQTDPDCANMRSIQGKHASYNVQSVVDDEKGLIVNAEPVQDTSDINQFARQIEQAQEVTEKHCDIACADAGYADTEELEKIDNENTKVIVPSQRQALHKEEGPFTKQHFTYDKDRDCYYCLEGHCLAHVSTEKKTGRKRYQITDKQLCFSCKHWGKCTTSKTCGRRTLRLSNEETKERLEAQYEKPESQKIYARRKTRVEHPFGHLKRNLKIDAFLLRGRDGVEAETSLMCTCFNIARMITLLGGVPQLIQKLKGITLNPA
jgi:transposase/acetolactate synthase small subunit